ncbi:Signal transduction histidine kinase [Sulfitobacter marinus]|uniref:histidine kinase n=1 Tax=Sulfitobacter marinus TaxID=394264 RepID=A0A1I6QQP2_9RHOB|nr:GAF domain-containing sensor histidine kinase [Sulfitobacter marinus]SFS54682.1 Signal transduction histidine kinase [Sulfitobacter marinus]
MILPPVPKNEAERLAYIDLLGLDLAIPYEEIQGLCEVASALAGAPVALVTLIAETQQHVLAGVGLGGVKQTSRDVSFCAHAIMGSAQFEVTDAQADPRFEDHPFVVGQPGFRSYLGTVLEPEEDMRLGTLCVLDVEPKTYSDDVKAGLSKIGAAITALIVSYREKRDLIGYAKELATRNTEMIDLTGSLRQSMEKLVAAENTKNEFVSIVSHELRTPLTSIKGALSLMRKDMQEASSAKAQRLVQIAYENSERLLSLVDDILRLRKQEFGTGQVSFGPVDLSALIDMSAEAYRNYAADRQVTLTVSGTGQPCIVSGDKSQLDRVLANILSNAFKFSKRGGNVEISLHCDEDGPQIIIKDDGVGIPDGSKEKVFGLFSQVDGSDARLQNGAGLGMHICKQILTQHGATIDYESELGVGTMFTIRFAAADQSETAG